MTSTQTATPPKIHTANDPNRKLKRLSRREVDEYYDRGYIKGYRVFDEAGVKSTRQGFEELIKLLKPGETPNIINGWERFNPYIFGLCSNPVMLDYVEDLLGPNFVLWGTHFFCKYPGDGTQVGWHQDARYWPLSPHKTATAWLAVDDSDQDNGAMRVIPGTHRTGIVGHESSTTQGNVLGLQIKSGEIDEKKAEYLTLKAGEISLHDDNLAHGSAANVSTRRRCGLTMRFCTTDVKGDTNVWAGFATCLMRGVDEYNLNPKWTLEPGGREKWDEAQRRLR